MLIPIILSGGVGSRLWPLSRKAKPKHFMPLIDDGINNSSANPFSQKSLLQQTILRCSADIACSNNPFATGPVMVCDRGHRYLVTEQCQELNITPEAILLEPERRDTAAAIMLAVCYLYQKYPSATVLVSPSDHYMSENDYYFGRISSAVSHAEDGNIVCFGIKPNYPETGYGYIKADTTTELNNNSFRVKKFLEKPDFETAKQFLAAGDCFWNSGMYMFRLDVIIELCKKLQPDLYNYCMQTVQTQYTHNEFTEFEESEFNKINPISIDYALMQDAPNMVVVKYDGQWADVGSWHGVWQNSPQAQDTGDVVMGNVINQKTKNCYLRSDSRLIVALGVDNVAVIETPDAVLVADIDSSKTLGKIVEQYMGAQQKEFIEHSHVHRPWGEYIVLHEQGSYKVKKLVIRPGASLSLQSHQCRSEHWVVVSGLAEVVRGEEVLSAKANDSLYIPKTCKHRITNASNSEELVIIEVQVGDYLGEDDIIRYHDIYGRTQDAIDYINPKDSRPT